MLGFTAEGNVPCGPLKSLQTLSGPALDRIVEVSMDVSSSSRSLPENAYRKLDKEMNRVSLLVSSEDFPFRITYHIYGDKVAFYSQNVLPRIYLAF